MWSWFLAPNRLTVSSVWTASVAGPVLTSPAAVAVFVAAATPFVVAAPVAAPVADPFAAPVADHVAVPVAVPVANPIAAPVAASFLWAPWIFGILSSLECPFAVAGT